MKERKTIFDLERRRDLLADYSSIIDDIKTTGVTTKYHSFAKLINLLNDSIKTWPYRQAAVSIDSYANAHGFAFVDPKKSSDIIYDYELLVNLLHWASECDKNTRDLFALNEQANVSEECLRCIENIEYNLEMVNMRIRKINSGSVPKYVVSKRDAQVDAVLESVPELSEALLSYLDVRNEHDEQAKKSVLKAIADFLEPKRKSYNKTKYNELCENLFTVFNKASIRHNNSEQWKLRKAERIKLYDQTFKAAVHLLQMEATNAFNKRIAELKQQEISKPTQ